MSVNLQKGQKISLDKESGSPLTEVVMGLGWDVARGEASIDLDASCLMFNDSGEMMDSIWFRQLKSKDGSIQHTGDNLTGDGEGDDEQIIVNLPKVPSNIKTLVFTVNSFTGQNFSTVANAFCRIVDTRNKKEIAIYDLSVQGNHTAQIMAKIYRHNGEWKMHAIGENGIGKTFVDLMPKIKTIL